MNGTGDGARKRAAATEDALRLAVRAIEDHLAGTPEGSSAIELYVRQGRLAAAKELLGATAPEAGAAPAAKAHQAGAGREIVIYTDGSCLGNGTPSARGGWAFVTTQDEQVIGKGSGKAAGVAATNNAMELLAVLNAVRSTPTGSRVTIATDSQLVIGWLFQQWKCKVEHNKALIADIRREMATRQVRHVKVKGHATDAFNNMVDSMAVAAAGSA